jgi:hypothetical protein
MSVRDNEGVRFPINDPYIKIMGLEAIKSTFSKDVRKLLTDGIKKALYEDEASFQQFMRDSEKTFRELPLDSISKRVKVATLNKYKDPHHRNNGIYLKGVSQQARAALLYNHLIQQKGISDIYHEISEGDSIKILELRLPNPLQENVIAYDEDLPEEFNLHPYIDYQGMYQKIFDSVLQSIVQSMGWSTEEKPSLDFLF